MSFEFKQSSITSGTFRSVCCDSTGRYLAACELGGNVYTSSDYGANWVVRTVASNSNQWQSICRNSLGDKLYVTGKLNVSLQSTKIWESNDYGVTWLNYVSGTQYNVNFTSICCNSTGFIIAACVDNGFILVSTDRGNSFTNRASSRSWKSVCINAVGNRLAAVEGNIWTSSDSGTTWVQKTTTPQSWISICSNSLGDRLAATVQNGNIWISTDYGDTWTEKVVETGNLTWLSICSNGTGQILAATHDTVRVNFTRNSIYISTDYGNTWTQRVLPSTSYVALTSICSSTLGDNISSCMFNGSGIIYSFMPPYNLNGNNVEHLLVINNSLSGISINGSSLFNFPSKYKAKIGSSIYSYTSIGYKISGVEQGNLLSPKIKVFDTVGTTTYTLQNNTRKILCICQGGGAGGTGGNGRDGDGESGGGGGGGGGGGLAWILYVVNGLETINIRVGGAGAGGGNGDPVGFPGGNGALSNCILNGITLCTGNGGLPGLQSPDNNLGSKSGPESVGSVISNSNVLDSGTRNGIPGGNGENDPEQPRSSNEGYGGAGGNGGSTIYTYGRGADSPGTVTISPLSFNSVQFLNSNEVLDDSKSSFSQADFDGTVAFVIGPGVNYGQGGCGGKGESRNNGAWFPGHAGKQGFVVICEYGL